MRWERPELGSAGTIKESCRRGPAERTLCRQFVKGVPTEGTQGVRGGPGRTFGGSEIHAAAPGFFAVPTAAKVCEWYCLDKEICAPGQ